MLRLKLTLGLLATLIILFLVGIYGVWLFNDLGRAVDKVLRDNYDSIKVCHYMRTATARVNTYYSRGERPYPPLDQPGTLNQVEEQFRARLPTLEMNAKTQEERNLVTQLGATCAEYIHVYREIFEYFKEGGLTDRRIAAVRPQIPNLTLTITNVSEKILEHNEQQMFMANRAAEQKSRDSIRLLVIAMISAVIVFVLTYGRLGHSIITPIQNLTRSIRELRSRDFAQSLPVETDDELGALTREFNTMAEELRNFYRETDRKFIELNQVIRAMMTTLPYPLFILGEHDEVSRMNPAAERLANSLRTNGAMPNQVRKHLAAASVTEPEYRLDDLKQALLFRIDEQEAFFLPRIFPIVLEDGTVFGRALMLVDVTKFRWLDEMKSDLLSTLSHEIRTPLTAIRLVLHLLLEKSVGGLSAAQEELVTTARNDCERLLKTLNSILDLARMESGKSQLNLQPIPAARVIEESYQNFHDQAAALSHPLRVDVPETLPSVYADPERIPLVFSNFLSNALKYSDRDSEIVLQARNLRSEFVRFSVINSGPGLSEEEQARVFDKFYRAPGHKGDGAGLGLSIARQVVQAHDGRIGVISESEKKTEFYCDLPVARE
ncbi:MAG: HAMP domain-containing protein [Verrucomicrobia bacterium]|nr:HAMP domain-containing protein [Verrucomicrobiota bacterium]MBV8378884.1 HAMP domain-containing protein [Verrucomicrobiota bacterium]